MLADFMQPDASKINFKELADGVRYFKEEGGCRQSQLGESFIL